ncbi:hypothetical protein WMY93_022401 [Mugilogobius chulae]|uniref:PDZ domain-containing protein n=1 Tax=Mugilogobius chulae TaxID=88201 RepID=A0AAW0NB60_9GOBI
MVYYLTSFDGSLPSSSEASHVAMVTCLISCCSQAWPAQRTRKVYRADHAPAARWSLEEAAPRTGELESSLVSIQNFDKDGGVPRKPRSSGIHVVPYCSSLSGRGIEATSRSRKENLFQTEESIVQINDISLLDKTFAQSQEVFRQAMSAPLIRCEVLPAANKPRYEKSLIGTIFNPDSKSSSAKASPIPVRSKQGPNQPPDSTTNPNPTPRPKIDLRGAETKPEEPALESYPQTSAAAAAEVQALEKERQSPVPPAGGAVPSPTLKAQSKNPAAPALASLTKNNMKGGKKHKIDLKKGPEGLGFTVVTRDHTSTVPVPSW